jgi:hypothetical protein
MMKSLNFEKLGYLHDAIVQQISLVFTHSEKSLTITVVCDDDCGHAEWCGKTLTLTFAGLLRTSSAILGHVAGYDSVNFFNEGASAAMGQAIQQLSQMGISPPAIVLRLCLHSGSELEIACDSVAVCLIEKEGA